MYIRINFVFFNCTVYSLVLFFCEKFAHSLSMTHIQNYMYEQTFIEHIYICNDIKFIVENRNRRANTHELINKRPKKYLLTNHHHKTPICFYHPVLIKSIFLSCRKNTRNPTQTNYNWKHLQIAHEYDILLLFVQTKTKPTIILYFR